MNVTRRHGSVVAVLDTHVEGAEIVRQRQKAGGSMTTLSVAARDHNAKEHVVGYCNTGEGVRYGGKLGVFRGGFWGLLSGSAFLSVPDVGPMVVGGPLASRIVGALEGAAVSDESGPVGAALHRLGIPQDSIRKYEGSLKANGR